jgi:hypothetical protein
MAPESCMLLKEMGWSVRAWRSRCRVPMGMTPEDRADSTCRRSRKGFFLNRKAKGVSWRSARAKNIERVDRL